MLAALNWQLRRKLIISKTVTVQKPLLGDILGAGMCYTDQGVHLNRSVLETICGVINASEVMCRREVGVWVSRVGCSEMPSLLTA